MQNVSRRGKSSGVTAVDSRTIHTGERATNKDSAAGPSPVPEELWPMLLNRHRRKSYHLDKFDSVCSRDRSRLEQGWLPDVSLLRRKTQSGEKI